MIRYMTPELAGKCSKIEQEIMSDPKNFEATLHLNYTFVDLNIATPVHNDWSGMVFISLGKNEQPLGRIIFDAVYGTVRRVQSVGMMGYATFLNMTPEERREADAIWKNDLLTAIHRIFVHHDISKIRFCVFVGNHAQKHYRFLTKLVNGSIVGVFKNEIQLRNGAAVDQENYEIYREGWIDALTSGKLRISPI